LTGVLLGVVLLTASFFIFGPFLETRFGVAFRVTLPTIAEFQSLLWIVGAGFAVSLLPGFRAYRVSLSDGLSPRI